MRVGFISSYPPIECGIATYSQYLCEELRKKQTDVHVVTHFGGAGHQVHPSFDYEDGDLANKAFRVMSRFTPDVVHIQHEFGLFGNHYGVSVIPLIMQFRMAGIPVVTTLHTVYENIAREHRIIFESIFSNSASVIVHDLYQKASLGNILNEEMLQKIAIIPHGARDMEPVPHARDRLGLPEDKRIILMAGYLRPSKNFELIIDIFPEIMKQLPDAILVLASKTRGTGHRDYRDLIYDLISKSPNRDQIYILRGQLPQHTFDTAISASDVVVLPYNITSQSGILAHCFAFRKPVVTSNSEAMRQILDRTGAGLTCEGREEYIQNIVNILSDTLLAKNLAQKADQCVREEISWSIVADQHLDIYRSTMEIPGTESRIIMVE